MSTDDQFAFTLTTAVTPPKKFKVDDDEYVLYSADHFDPTQEAEALALLSRHEQIQVELSMTPNVAKGEAVATRLRTCRVLILTKFTDVPREKCEKFPLGLQIQLLEQIQADLDEDEDLSQAQVAAKELSEV